MEEESYRSLNASFFSSNSNDDYYNCLSWEEVIERSFGLIHEDWKRIIQEFQTISIEEGNHLKQLQNQGDTINAEDYKTIRIADALIFKILLKQALEEYYPYNRDELEIYSTAVYYGQHTHLVAWGVGFRCLNPRANMYGRICTLVCKFNKTFQAFLSLSGMGILPAQRNSKILNKIIVRAFCCHYQFQLNEGEIITRDTALQNSYMERIKKTLIEIKEYIFTSMDMDVGTEIYRKDLYGKWLNYTSFLYETRTWLDY